MMFLEDYIYMNTTIEEVIDSLKRGQGKRVKDLVKIALEEGIDPQDILEQGFLEGMAQVTERFRNEDVGVPEILSVTRALETGVKALNSYTGNSGIKPIGIAVIGSVDMHDIGKNLVKMMLKSKNIQVIDLGANVSPIKFYEESMASNADIVCLSGILEQSVQRLQAVVEEFEDRGARSKVHIMVGGYYVDKETAQKMGADSYTTDAGECAEQAYLYLTKKNHRNKKRK